MRALAFAVLFALAACGRATPEPVTSDAWTLAPQLSSIAYVTVKSGEIAETNTFRTVTGRVEPDGAARLGVALNSVETNVDIRNERMKNVFFEVADYPEAVATLALEPAEFSDLEIGDRTQVETALTLALHGLEAEYDAVLFVTRAGADRVVVETAAPVLVDVRDFELGTGLETLRSLANLPAITPVAPVSVSLVFERE